MELEELLDEVAKLLNEMEWVSNDLEYIMPAACDHSEECALQMSQSLEELNSSIISLQTATLKLTDLKGV